MGIKEDVDYIIEYWSERWERERLYPSQEEKDVIAYLEISRFEEAGRAMIRNDRQHLGSILATSYTSPELCDIIQLFFICSPDERLEEEILEFLAKKQEEAELYFRQSGFDQEQGRELVHGGYKIMGEESANRDETGDYFLRCFGTTDFAKPQELVLGYLKNGIKK